MNANAIRVGIAAGPVPVSTEPTIFFQWRERGGPPTAPPKHKGFGSVLLEHAIVNAGSPPRFDYAPQGFTYELRAALAVS